MAKYLIVGGVAAGMSAAARLRRLDEAAEIIVFERGDYVSYANCGLPYYIGDEIKERERLVVQTPEALRELMGIEVRTANEVLAVLPETKTVKAKDLKTGREYDETYDKLLLAPGGSPVKPPIPGSDHPAIHTLWTIPDTDQIRAMVDDGKVKKALVVGAGFIGLEMAENLKFRGIDVTVVEMAKQAMNVVDFEMASMVHREVAMHGVDLQLDDGVSEFTPGANGGVVAKLTSGKTVEADLVLLSIGVKPNTAFIAESGIELGKRGHILADDSLRTNKEDIFAAGDAIEVMHPLTNKKTTIPLAGPANKQGRIAADNMHGEKPRTYNGTMGTAIAKVFDLTIGMTGASEKLCLAHDIPFDSVIIHPNDFAGYYPGAMKMCLKVLFSPDTGKVLGAQSTGYSGVDKRIDVIATAIKANMTVDDLTEIEHAYAPPYSSAKDPVNMAGFVAQNVLEGLIKTVKWTDIENAELSEYYLLDVRTPAECASGVMPGSVNIPQAELRDRLNEIPRDKKVVLYCRVGLIAYQAIRVLAANGFENIYNLSGGYETWLVATTTHKAPETAPIQQTEQKVIPMVQPANEAPSKIVEVNACGLQCPGPVMRLKQEMDVLQPGEALSITASDPGFMSDAPAWARSTGNVVRDISVQKGIVKAVIEKAGQEPGVVPATAGNDKTIIVFSGNLDKVIASFIIANGALAMGRKVTLFFTFWGLNSLRKHGKVKGLRKNIIEKAFGWMMPRGSVKLPLSNMNMGGMGGKMIRGIMKHHNVPALEDMMTMAIQGGVNIVACQMSMDLMGIRKEELIDGVEIGGVAAYLEASEHSDNNLFI
ncbi:pyridine nucleotide-disulfide oxidoreductase [Syntrophotalea acetylenivorans]|uniref:Pyridine nucleotide-disulfide oxidoreductase n=1 Tax=Syntrophotalea acetylenivorans TaxID=1842532 RepID=A0A1L3GR39_9BACT|nr:FAD-dependent oxidoreductase [Syntrophotalea acetylenivorans]APG28373.1 pyridine nucleotide-disulfide oxidoreductase [Syntrophotalea acetylenivorans]